MQPTTAPDIDSTLSWAIEATMDQVKVRKPPVQKEHTNPRRPSDPVPSLIPALAGGRGGHHWTGLALFRAGLRYYAFGRPLRAAPKGGRDPRSRPA